MISKSNFGFIGRNIILDLIFITQNEINNITRCTSEQIINTTSGQLGLRKARRTEFGVKIFHVEFVGKILNMRLFNQNGSNIGKLQYYNP